METFGIVGMSLGTMGFIFAMNASARLNKLVKHLKEKGVLSDDYEQPEARR